jgi:uncharacterized OsmC-like protein
VLAKRKLSRISFEVVATGEKALASGNRLTAIAVVAIFQSGITESEAVAISEEAKPLCTVTNTILTSTDVVYSARAIKEQHHVAQEYVVPHVSH